MACSQGPAGFVGELGVDGSPGKNGEQGKPGIDGLDIILDPVLNLPCVICPAG